MTSSSVLTIEIRDWSSGLPPEDAAWALAAGLYELTHRQSRFLDIWQGDPPFAETRAFAAIAWQGELPVGIGLWELADESVPAIEGRYGKRGFVPKFRHEDFAFRHLGRLGLFVLPAWRGQGVASSLVPPLEMAVMAQTALSSDEIPLLSALADAFPIVDKMTAHVHVIEDNKPCMRRSLALSTLSRDLAWIRMSGQGCGPSGTLAKPSYRAHHVRRP